MRRAPRHRLRPGGAAVRAGQGAGQPPGEFGIGRYTGSQTSTKLKVTGIDLFSAGNFMGGEGTEEIVMSDPFGGVYKKLVLKDDKLVGACLYGDTVDGSWYFKLLREGRSVADIRDKLMFGESNIGDVGHQGHNKAAAMADTDEVCGCNGVTKGTICKAIKDKGLFTLDEVRKHTKASASCGSCTGLVEQLLMFTAGGDYSATPKNQGHVRLHRPRPPGGARRHPRRTSC
jgi:nitrite reductase (NADH) large subunit